jgi:hypothetical protein
MIQSQSNGSNLVANFSFKIEFNTTSDVLKACEKLVNFTTLNNYGNPLVFKFDGTKLFCKVN